MRPVLISGPRGVAGVVGGGMGEGFMVVVDGGGGGGEVSVSVRVSVMQVVHVMSGGFIVGRVSERVVVWTMT